MYLKLAVHLITELRRNYFKQVITRKAREVLDELF